MCGITGIIRKDKNKPYDSSDMINMVRSQCHRGPNDSGIYALGIKTLRKCSEDSICLLEDEEVGFFGFSRLSIIDLSNAGHQPMVSANNRVVIDFNGEIYNAFDFRKELESKGYVFRSDTDTEIILNMYLEYGFSQMVSKLNGMFAIAIYDSDSRKLYLARDRFGIKPLYIMNNSECVAFASEIKSFLEIKSFNPEIDITGFQETFVFGNCFKRSLLKGVFPVQPGEIIVINDLLEIKKELYFDVNEYSRPVKPKKSFYEYKKNTEDVIMKCVKRQMVSDVKLGCQLSGGIDSSLISLYASKTHNSKLNDCIAVVFEQKHKAYNEEQYVDYVREKLDLELHKCTLDENYYLSNLQKVIWHLDTIPAYYNELGILLLSEEAKKHVTVLLSGEGADELMAGYTRIAYQGLVEKLSKIHAVIPSCIKEKIWKGRCESMDNYIVFKEAVPFRICTSLIDNYDESMIANDRLSMMKNIKGDNFDRQIKYEMSIRLQGLLNRQDKTTMANSIENRVPFLDNEMVDFAFSLPQKYLLHMRFKDCVKNIRGTHVQGKYILKELCKDEFGERFAYRDKGGFGIPCRDYLRNREMKEYCMNSIIPNMKKRGIMNADLVSQWYQKLDSITQNEENALWRALTLEMWAELFVDRKRE